MNTADLNFDLVNNYFAMLKHLNNREKAELITRLKRSIQSKIAEKEDDWESLFGSFKLDQPAEELLSNTKK